MERATLDFSLPNFITVGLIAAAWYIVIVGASSLMMKKSGKTSA